MSGRGAAKAKKTGPKRKNTAITAENITKYALAIILAKTNEDVSTKTLNALEK